MCFRLHGVSFGSYRKRQLDRQKGQQRQIFKFFSLHTVLFIPRPHKRFLVVFDFTAEVSFLLWF